MKVAFTTLGCRTNQHDTAEMQTLLKKEGFQVVDQTDLADIYVVNTCTVTSKSDYRSRLAVKKSLGLNEKALVVFTGCYAQNQPEQALHLPGIGLILGNANKLDILKAIKIALAKEEDSPPEVYMSEIGLKREFKPLAVEGFQGKTKAFIKIQTGCDEACSFCTVVKARGSSISASRSNILKNVQNAVSSGFREVTLSGINLGTWGLDFQIRETFSSLVEDILNLPGDFRVRLSSINPMEIDIHLIRLMANNPKLCPHLHIPLQSGDDKILERMRRNYNTSDYRRVVDKAVELIPDLGLGADVIVGFPGETEEQFKNTCRIIESLPFSYLHVFSYSPRPGTEAISFNNEIPTASKKIRNHILMDLIQTKARHFRKSFLGKTVNILVESQREVKSGFLKGHSQHYIPIVFPGGDELINKIVPVSIDCVSDHQVLGCSLL